MDIKERVDRMEIDMSFIFGWMGCTVVSMGRCMFAVAPNRNYEHIKCESVRISTAIELVRINLFRSCDSKSKNNGHFMREWMRMDFFLWCGEC